jgi:exonuclease VII small subunit
MQKKAIEKNVHFEEMIREFKKIVKKKLKTFEHVNVITFQN